MFNDMEAATHGEGTGTGYGQRLAMLIALVTNVLAFGAILSACEMHTGGFSRCKMAVWLAGYRRTGGACMRAGRCNGRAQCYSWAVQDK